MGSIHFNDSKRAKHYLSNPNYRSHNQGVHFDMEENTEANHLKEFNEILHKKDNF